jgi:HK97 gp10 family phage protein
MAVRAKITTTGLEETLEALANMGRDVDIMVDQALEAGGGVLLEGMQRRVPKDTRNLEKHLALEGPIQDGNYHYILVGMERGIDAETARYGNSQEYGTSSMAAQPYIRPTIDEDLRKARREMLDVLKKAGK